MFVFNLCRRKQMKNCCASIYAYPCAGLIFFSLSVYNVDLEKDWNGSRKKVK